MKLETCITLCAAQFELYARNHRAKGTPEAIAKAEVNERFARMCQHALNPMNAINYYEAGRQAYRDGRALEDQEYSPGSHAYQEWRDGWTMEMTGAHATEPPAL
jgi:hypothetical protein